MNRIRRTARAVGGGATVATLATFVTLVALPVLPVPAAPTPTGSAPVGLTVTVARLDGTGPVVVGAPVRIRVRWSDDDGRPIGAAEEWGDGEATSSLQPIDCRGTAGRHAGSFPLSHRYRRAGVHRLTVAVTTATCDGRAERRTASLTVVVTPAPRRATPPPYR